MPLELGLLSEGLCYLGLSRDYSLQSYLSPAPLWLCAHSSAPSSGWLPSVLSPWSRLCGFRLLRCFPVHLLNHPLSQPEGIVHSSCVLLGKHLGRGCVVGCVTGCWPHSGSTVQRVLDTGALTLCYFGKNNCREDSWGVSRQSYIRVLSYSFLAAFFSL